LVRYRELCQFFVCYRVSALSHRALTGPSRVQRGTDTDLTGSANRGRLRTGAPVLRVVYTRTPVAHRDTGRRLQPTEPGNNRALDQGS